MRPSIHLSHVCRRIDTFGRYLVGERDPLCTRLKKTVHAIRSRLERSMRLTPLGKLLLFVIGLAVAGFALYQAVPRIRHAADRALGRALATTPATLPENRPAPASSGAEIRLRLRGSNTIGRDLAPALAEKFLEREGATEIESVREGPEQVVVSGHLPDGVTALRIEIQAHGTSTAFDSLKAGTADIGLASRRISSDERRALATLGDLTSPASEHVLALDGVAIVVHASNPVDSLNLEQVRGIFSGQLADWSQVGGRPGPIVLRARDSRSGTFDTFKALVLGAASLPATTQRYEDGQQLAGDVASDPRSIGFVGLAYVGDTRALKIGDGESIAYRPTVFTVRTESYRLSRRLYLYTPQSAANPWTSRFVSFALSDAGQAVVDTVGFVGQALSVPVPGPTLIESTAPPAYLRGTRGAVRMPLDYRFDSGSDRLDNKALRDVGRLVQSLSLPDRRSATVLLFGFADSQGSPGSNLSLSRSRAEAIARELRAEGIEPSTIEGFGSALPVASNVTDEGRGRNRRVEVWIR